MIENKIKSTPILYGEDARRFEEALENPKPVSREEIERAYESYKHFRRMGMCTVDDLKCCGNCKKTKDLWKCNYFTVISPHNICNEWEFDGLIKEDRK